MVFFFKAGSEYGQFTYQLDVRKLGLAIRTLKVTVD